MKVLQFCSILGPASVGILQRIGMTQTRRGEETRHLDRPTFHRQFRHRHGMCGHPDLGPLACG